MIVLREVDTEEACAERAAVQAGRLPMRYAEPWGRAFFSRIEPELNAGVRILDVGSGARPTIAVDQRPSGCHYVGLDVSADELARAPAGSYDETVVADICGPIPELAARFDLVISWQVLEHVPSMRAALSTLGGCLAADGRFVAHLSGTWAVYALLGRVLPHTVRTRLMHRLLGTDPEDRFPTYYDACSARALKRLLPDVFSSAQVIPRYKAGGYLRFSPTLQKTYLAYENRIERQERANLATHYIIDARR